MKLSWRRELSCHLCTWAGTSSLILGSFHSNPASPLKFTSGIWQIIGMAADLRTSNCHRHSCQLHSLSQLFPTACPSMACTSDIPQILANVPFPKLEHMGLFKNASLGRLKYTQKMSIASFKLNPLDFDQPAPFSHKPKPCKPCCKPICSVPEPPTPWRQDPTPVSAPGRAKFLPASLDQSVDRPPGTLFHQGPGSCSQYRKQCRTEMKQLLVQKRETETADLFLNWYLVPDLLEHWKSRARSLRCPSNVWQSAQCTV